jgi:hypothetical protein
MRRPGRRAETGDGDNGCNQDTARRLYDLSLSLEERDLQHHALAEET